MTNWLALAALLVVSVGTCGEALAQAQLDPPVLRVVEVSRVSIALDVEAGPSGAPAGFRVEWMLHTDYDRLGGWPVAYDPSVMSCSFIGTPTLNPSTGSYRLSGDANVQVELGDLFDETGVVTRYYREMSHGEEYMMRASAQPTATQAASEYSATAVAITQALPPENCTYTLGYWKTHPEAWLASSLTLGTVSYTKTELLSILNTPARGNGLLILAHQVIATELNILSGADVTPVATALADAHALIGSLVVPPIGSGWLDPMAVNDTKDILDSYNNGLLGVPHCGALPVRPSTWGALKAVYR